MADTRRTVINDIEGMNSMEEFIVTNEEIAANNMRRIRDAVVGRRDFLSEITELYNDVRKSYKQEVQKILSGRKSSKNSKEANLLQNKPKTVCALITTNATLYGDIVSNTYSLFKKTASAKDVDVVIVGKTGKRVFEEDKPGAPYTYFEIPDNIIDFDNSLLKPIIIQIIQYERVIVFHSKFETLVRQSPTAFVISESQPGESRSKHPLKYIFEPSLEKIIEYFEKEIFSTIFENTMHESDLSKFASRMVTLDSASGNIKKKLSGLYNKQRYLQHQKVNKDQVNSLAVIMMRRNR